MSDTPSAPARTIRFAGETMTAVPLADPLEVDGQTVAEIRISKLTIGAYRQHTEAGGKSEVLNLPMFADVAGAPVPQDVLDALSIRDAQTVTEVASGFLNTPPKAGADTSASA